MPIPAEIDYDDTDLNILSLCTRLRFEMESQETIIRYMREFIKGISSRIIDRQLHKALLFRTFSPFSEPKEYRHEDDSEWDVWKSEVDCWQCPFAVIEEAAGYKWVDACKRDYKWGAQDPETGEALHWAPCLMRAKNDSFCRFTEYRRILFRRFERITEDAR